MSNTLQDQQVCATYKQLFHLGSPNLSGCTFYCDNVQLPFSLNENSIGFSEYLALSSSGAGLTFNTYITAAPVDCNTVVGFVTGATTRVASVFSTNNFISAHPACSPHVAIVGSHFNSLCALATVNTTFYNTHNSTLLPTRVADTYLINTYRSKLSTVCGPSALYNVHDSGLSAAQAQVFGMNTCMASVSTGMLAGGTCLVFVGGFNNSINSCSFPHIYNGYSHCIEFQVGSSNGSYIYSGNNHRVSTWTYATIVTGQSALMSQCCGTIFTGHANTISATCISKNNGLIFTGDNISILHGEAMIASGTNNCMLSGTCSAIITGISNRIFTVNQSCYHAIFSGKENFIYGFAESGARLSRQIITGVNNIISAGNSSCQAIIGGCDNLINLFGHINGGSQNAMSATCTGTTIEGGQNNLVAKLNTGAIWSGRGNVIDNGGSRNSIFGGLSNMMCGNGGSGMLMGGGCNNQICSTNLTTGTFSIWGGSDNSIRVISGAVNEYGRQIIHGYNNHLLSTGNMSFTTIIGGRNNVTRHDRTVLFGSSLSSTGQNQTRMNKMIITDIPTSPTGLPSGAWYVDAPDTRIKQVP